MKGTMDTYKSFSSNRTKARKLSQDQKRQNNKSENRFKLLLDSAGVIYEQQKPFYNDQKYCVVDFYIPLIKTVVEIDGRSHAKTKGKDQQRTAFLLKFRNVEHVLRVRNDQMMTKGIECIHEIKELHKQVLGFL